MGFILRTFTNILLLSIGHHLMPEVIAISNAFTYIVAGFMLTCAATLFRRLFGALMSRLILAFSQKARKGKRAVGEEAARIFNWAFFFILPAMALIISFVNGKILIQDFMTSALLYLLFGMLNIKFQYKAQIA